MRNDDVIAWAHSNMQPLIRSTKVCNYSFCMQEPRAHLGGFVFCRTHAAQAQAWHYHEELLRPRTGEINSVEYRIGLAPFHETSNNKGKIGQFMSNARKAIKNALMSKEDRLVRKYAVVNTDGSPNAEGRKVLNDILWEQNFDKVIERLEKVEAAEEKANKKK